MKRLTLLLIPILVLSTLPSRSEDRKEGKAEPPKSGLVFKKWSGDLNVPDPVAISLDHHGRAYVTQTQRRKAQDLDIRQFRDWIPHDVGFQSVEDKRAFYHRNLAPGKGDKRIKDLNGDGSHDYHDLMVLSDRIHLLEDTDGDGTADRTQIFADDFRTEVSGIGAGVLWHDGEVFLTIVPDVFRLRDTDGDGIADEREIIATGFGVHLAYAGHDMHGLTVGPDGKIYWSIGDKGVSVTSAEGRKFHYPNQGCVLRCNPDGSEFEVFAHGLRNVQELAFDEFGNLFGVDNDADQPGEKERFVYIVRGMDAGWRCNYQYRGDRYNPWNSEGLWKTIEDSPDRPAYAMPPIADYIDGPCGFAYNPGTALGPGWERTFFLTGAPGGVQYAFQVKAAGAGFTMINSRQIGRGIPITGWTFGPDGGLYGTDWGVVGYPLTQSGAVWKIDVPDAERNPERERTAALLAADFGKLDKEELSKELANPDQRVRLKAQFELVRRKQTGTLLRAAETGLVHGVWGLGQLRAKDELVTLTKTENSEIRAQVARVAADLETFPEETLQKMVRAGNPRVGFFALQALRHHGSTASQDLVVEQIEENDGKDRYLRHAGVMALAAMAPDSLAKLAGHPSVEVQRCAVVALREQGSALVTAFLDGDESVATEAAMAIHDDFSIPKALPALAEALSRHDNESFVRRALNANLRLGTPDHARRVAEWAADGRRPLPLRRVAIGMLTEWIEPSEFDQVDGRIRRFSPRDRKAVAAAIRESVATMLQDEAPSIQAGGMRLARQFAIELDAVVLLSVVESPQASDEVRLSALDIVSDDAKSLRAALDSGSTALRIRALELLTESDPESARTEAMTFLKGKVLREQQAAIRSLQQLKAVAELTPLVTELVAGKLAPGIQLEVIEAGKSLGIDEGLPALLAQRLDILNPASFPECLEGGSPETGAEIFRTHIAAQCIRCHKVARGKGSIIGPNLENTAAKGADYLLEALVAPQTVIAEGYGNITVTLKDGTVVAGQFRSENDRHLVVRDPASNKETKVKKEDIADRTAVVSVMPPMGAILQRGELRDVMAYLLTLKKDG